jgi:hypothetical protein
MNHWGMWLARFDPLQHMMRIGMRFCKGYSRSRFLKLLREHDYLENVEKQQSMLQLCSELWNCADPLPENARIKLDKLFQSYFDEFEKSPPAWTYGQAVRRMKTILDGSCSKKYLIRIPASGRAQKEKDDQ